MQAETTKFNEISRPHILMLTIHGVHEWDVVPGLTDTGGQNVYVNQFTEELAQQGYKITIANRGGYPHPVTGKIQTGSAYKDQYQRILYLEDGFDQFVRKEDMDGQTIELASHLANMLQDENAQVDMIISHYWDAAVIGELLKENLGNPISHVWVPHSLGAIKKRNVDEDRWLSLRIDERIQNERKILSKVNWVATTSPIISESLQQDYDYQNTVLWIPPCISTSRYFPHRVAEDAEVWGTLSRNSGLPVEEIQKMKIITEISRTDTTKRKDILLKAFAQLVEGHPNTLLAITIEKQKDSIGSDLIQLINTLNIRQNVAILGSVWNLLPDIYAISKIYCTPSIMEGFGMAAQEAAATGVPVVASNLVPFATQYLHGRPLDNLSKAGDPISIGQGTIVVKPDHVEGFAQALGLLLSDEQQRQSMGRKAYQITIPRFTWSKVVEKFIQSITKEQTNA